MSTDNNVVDLQEFDIPATMLDNVDLTLPDDYSDEIYAQQLLDSITQYHTYKVQYRSLWNQGDNIKAEIASKLAAICRAQAALIQSEHPNTIKLYKILADFKAAQIRRNRAHENTLG